VPDALDPEVAPAAPLPTEAAPATLPPLAEVTPKWPNVAAEALAAAAAAATAWPEEATPAVVPVEVLECPKANACPQRARTAIMEIAMRFMFDHTFRKSGLG
jgi:hypothetical protein